jgi:hypothetical protein
MAGVAHPSGVMPPVRSNDVVLVYPARPAEVRSAISRGGSVTGETLDLSSLTAITATSMEHNSLAPREFMLARMATLIEVDTPPAGLANAEAGTPRKRGDSGA